MTTPKRQKPGDILTPCLSVLADVARGPDKAIPPRTIARRAKIKDTSLVSSCLSSHIRNASSTNLRRRKAPKGKGHGSHWLYYWSHRAKGPQADKAKAQKAVAEAEAARATPEGDAFFKAMAAPEPRQTALEALTGATFNRGHVIINLLDGKTERLEFRKARMMHKALNELFNS